MRTSFLQMAGLIVLGVGSRLIPHPPNMTAIGAIALKSRERFGLLGLCIPLVSMVLADAIIGFYDWRLLLSVYASFVLFGILGIFLQKNRSVAATAATAAFGSTLFFLTTNTVVWALSSWYPHDIGGLLACLAVGLPFYRNMLIGDVVATLAICKLPHALATRGLRRYLDEHILRTCFYRCIIRPADPLRLYPDNDSIGIAQLRDGRIVGTVRGKDFHEIFRVRADLFRMPEH